MKDQELRDKFHAYRPQIDDNEAFMDKFMAQMDAVDDKLQHASIIPLYRRILPWAAAACLLALVGVGITLLFNRQETTIQPIAQQQDKPTTAVSDEAPCIANVQKVQNPTAQKTKHVPRKVAKRQKASSEKPDTLGDGIWKQKENVVLALQMLAECEAAGEQIQRNTIVEAAFQSTIKPHALQLVVSESGDYMVVDDSQPSIIEL